VPRQAQSSLAALAVAGGFLTEVDCDEAWTAAMALVVIFTRTISSKAVKEGIIFRFGIDMLSFRFCGANGEQLQS
jgi:hypothetical protein